MQGSNNNSRWYCHANLKNSKPQNISTVSPPKIQRRLTSAEKSKGLALCVHEPPRKARVRVEKPLNQDLANKHALTLIGRITNPSVQKVGSLITFFTEHWNTTRRPRGSDLGLGMFQFHFETESDLLAVLEKRPYHFAKWMIILQRWKPTISPSFPSLIPFWIKIQGVPVHLWTEAVVRGIGEDIGIFDTFEQRYQQSNTDDRRAGGPIRRTPYGANKRDLHHEPVDGRRHRNHSMESHTRHPYNQRQEWRKKTMVIMKTIDMMAHVSEGSPSQTLT